MTRKSPARIQQELAQKFDAHLGRSALAYYKDGLPFEAVAVILIERLAEIQATCEKMGRPDFGMVGPMFESRLAVHRERLGLDPNGEPLPAKVLPFVGLTPSQLAEQAPELRGLPITNLDASEPTLEELSASEPTGPSGPVAA